jgi:two-component system OmpR family sensor kinase
MATSSRTHRPIWERSLYWRIVLGFCACITGVLAAQTAAVLVLFNSVPDGQRLNEFTQAVAADIATALKAEPGLDVQHYVDTRYPRPLASLYIIMARNTQVVLSGPDRPAEAFVVAAREYWAGNPTSLPDSWITGPFHTTPIVVGGKLTGGVGVVVPQSWRHVMGWKMAVLGGVLLLVGTALAGRFIFGSVRVRLGDLEQAARRCGAGDFSARAQESGSDELAALASAFNRMAADLGARDELLKAADRTRRILLADVSHELMTPLTALRAYREVLAMSELGRDPEASHGLAVMADETQRLERLVGDLLDLARLEAGGDSLNREDVAMENLFGRVAARHEPEARLKGIALTTSIASGAELLYGDGLRLEQALQNLAANALRHTPPGGDVELRAELNGDDVLVSVRDTGAGIPQEHVPFVFDRFYKVDPARAGNRASGSGLGLSVVKAIVERHGGTVSASSQPGVATIFTIRLPLDIANRSGLASPGGDSPPLRTPELAEALATDRVPGANTVAEI